MASQVPLRLPKELHEDVKQLAIEQGISMNQFLVYALATKVSEMKHSRSFFESKTKGRTKAQAATRMAQLLERVPVDGPVAEEDLLLVAVTTGG